MNTNKKILINRYRSLPRTICMIANISLSSFYFGYTMIYLTLIDLYTLIDHYSITIDHSVAQGILNACIPAGALIGALISRFVLQSFSRRQCLLNIDIAALTLGILIFIPNFYALLIARILQGFCVGLNSAIAPIVIKQLAPLQLSGIFSSFHQVALAFSSFFASFLTFMLSELLNDPKQQSVWKFIFGFSTITTLIQICLLLFVFPYETPKYLLMKGQRKQAQDLIRIIYLDEYIQQILEQKQKDIKAIEEIQKNRQQSSSKQSLFQSVNQGDGNSSLLQNNSSQFIKKNKQVIWLTLSLSIHIGFVQQYSGINAVVNYGAPIAGQVIPSWKLAFSWILNLLKFFGAVSCSFIGIRLGRKTLLQFGTISSIFLNFFVGIGCLIRQQHQEVSNFFVLTGLFLFMPIYGCTLGPLAWFYISEILQPALIPFSTTANWIGALSVIFLFPIVKDLGLGGNPGWIFMFFSTWCLFSSVINGKFIIQTKDKTEKEINQEFREMQICKLNQRQLAHQQN